MTEIEKKKNQENQEKNHMSVEEAGKKGGLRTRETHGHEFYHEIGKMGGAVRAREIREEGISQELHEKLSMAGHKGGEATKKTHGREYYQEIGRRGGSAPRGGEVNVPEGDVIIRYNEKELYVRFSSQEEAEEWRNRFALIMQQEGYHLSRDKP